MRQTFNYHTHTARCGHAVGSDEEYVRAAIEAGFTTLGISDHNPVSYFSRKSERMDWDELDDYLSSMHGLREKYRDQIDLKIGFEIEYFPEQQQELDYLASLVDYMIVGQHNSTSDFLFDYYFYSTPEEVARYAELVCQAMDTGRYLYIAHPEYFMINQKSFTPDARAAAHAIGRKAAETGTPLEINLGGILKGIKHFEEGPRYWYPFREFWEIVSQYPVRCVYGYDAHSPSVLKNTQVFEICDRVLEGLDLEFIKEPLI